jgi:hypothetical protein
MRRMLLSAAVLFLSLSAFAQFPDAPSHSHFSKTFLVGQLALEGVDAYQTYRDASIFWERGQGPWFHELNPIARPFVRRGPGSTVGYFAAEAGVKIGVPYLLHRTGHHKLEKYSEMISLSFSAYGVGSRAFRPGHSR